VETPVVLAVWTEGMTSSSAVATARRKEARLALGVFVHVAGSYRQIKRAPPQALRAKADAPQMSGEMLRFNWFLRILLSLCFASSKTQPSEM
jgi:hypothetical protein